MSLGRLRNYAFPYQLGSFRLPESQMLAYSKNVSNIIAGTKRTVSRLNCENAAGLIKRLPQREVRHIAQLLTTEFLLCKIYHQRTL
jgi:hypothetical protein